MCRLAAYSGPDISLQDFIITPPHSLYRQSWEPKEMHEAKLNADGFGFCWYEDQLPKRYRSTQAIWSDLNLPELAGSLKQSLWLAYVRSATIGQGMGPDNTQPFVHNNISFIHNGYIDGFETIKPKLIDALDKHYLAIIRGNTDSEHLFALWLQSLAASGSILDSFSHFWSTIQSICSSNPVLLSLIISDGGKLYAFKQAIEDTPPSLYFCEKAVEDKAIFIASEPFDDKQCWISVEPGQLLIVDESQSCQLKMIN